VFSFGRKIPEPLVPPRLIGVLRRFLLLAGLAFVLATMTPATVGDYRGSMEGAHGGRLLVYVLTLLMGFLGMQIGEDSSGPAFGRRSWLRQAGRAATLGLIALALVAPLLLVYRAWTGTPWDVWTITVVHLLFGFACWAVVGAGLITLVQWDPLRYVTKYVLFASIMFLPLSSPRSLSPLLTVAEAWEGQAVGGMLGWGPSAGAAVFFLGVMTWKARRSAYSVGPFSGQGQSARFAGR